jgi:hypothetical protein
VPQFCKAGDYDDCGTFLYGFWILLETCRMLNVKVPPVLYVYLVPTHGFSWLEQVFAYTATYPCK